MIIKVDRTHPFLSVGDHIYGNGCSFGLDASSWSLMSIQTGGLKQFDFAFELPIRLARKGKVYKLAFQQLDDFFNAPDIWDMNNEEMMLRLIAIFAESDCGAS